MKGIIRKTGEEITIVSFYGNSDRREPLLDYVSYIDSNGVEHPRERMNLYWDVEVINEQKELIEQQVKNAKLALEGANRNLENILNKREMVAMNVFVSIVNGIYAHGNAKYWSPEEIAQTTAKLSDCFMETFIKEEPK